MTRHLYAVPRAVIVPPPRPGDPLTMPHLTARARPGFTVHPPISVPYGYRPVPVATLICAACDLAVAAASDTDATITARQDAHACTRRLPDPYGDDAPPIPPGRCLAHTAWPASPWRCLVAGCPGRQPEDPHA